MEDLEVEGAEEAGEAQPNRPSIIQKRAILGIALAVLVFWAPLPFASVEPEARALLLGAGALLAVPGVLLLRRTPVPGPALALAGLALLGLAQCLPLPSSWLALVSPRRAELAASAATLLGGQMPEGLAISFAPRVTLAVSVQFLALAASWIAVSGSALARRSRRWMLGSLLLSALFQAGYGGLNLFRDQARIWQREVEAAETGRLRGTFVNPDHAAFFLNLALPVAFAWFVFALRRSRGRPAASRLGWLAPPLVLWFALFLAIALTGSRAGLLAAVVATLGQGLIARSVVSSVVSSAPRGALVRPIGLVLVVVAFAVLALTSYERTLGRAASTSVYELRTEQRVLVYGATARLIGSAPWLGTGLGTFRDVFPAVQPSSVGGSWQHAHNDLLELVLVAGLAGAAVAVIGALLVMRQLARSLRHGRRAEDRAVALAALGALAAALVHSAFDYGLTMPANALALVVVLATAAASARPPAAVSA